MSKVKYLLLFVLSYCSPAIAQTTLTSDKTFIECEDKWIAMFNKDNSLTFGFVYIDTQAGLTLDVAGTFKIVDNIFVPSKRENSSMKVRIPLNNNKVAIIPLEKLKELEVDSVPDWLKIYKGENTSVARWFRLGFTYNLWEKCEQALVYLDKVKAIDPNYKGLKFEYAFAYNTLKQFDKALVVLNDAIKEDPKDCYLHKEIVFAQMNLKKPELAAASAKIGIETCNDNAIKGEIAYNVSQQYYLLKDKEAFKKWELEAKKWLPSDHKWYKNLAIMNAELNK